MGKDNGIIRDGVKGGNQMRVQGGAAHVRLVNGIPGGLVVFPIPQTQGGTARSSAMTDGSVVFAGPTTYEEDNPNFFWNNTDKRLGIGTNTTLAPLSFGAGFGLPNGTAGRKINLFSGNAHYSIGLNGGTVWTTSQIFIDFYRKDVGVDQLRARFDVASNRFHFGDDADTDETNCTLQVVGPDDQQFSIKAPSGDQFTTFQLFNDTTLVGFFSHDHVNAYNMLGFNGSRVITYDDVAAIIGINQAKPNPLELAVLQLVGDGQQGLTIPRVTQSSRNIMEGILSGNGIVGGNIIYDVDTQHFYGFNGTIYVQLDN